MILDTKSFLRKRKVLARKVKFIKMQLVVRKFTLDSLSEKKIVPGLKFLFSACIIVFALSSSSLSQNSSEIVLENVSVTSIRDEQNFLWIATYGQGIYKYSKKDDKWTNYSTSNNALDNDLFSCLALYLSF